MAFGGEEMVEKSSIGFKISYVILSIVIIISALNAYLKGNFEFMFFFFFFYIATYPLFYGVIIKQTSLFFLGAIFTLIVFLIFMPLILLPGLSIFPMIGLFAFEGVVIFLLIIFIRIYIEQKKKEWKSSHYSRLRAPFGRLPRAFGPRSDNTTHPLRSLRSLAPPAPPPL